MKKVLSMLLAIIFVFSLASINVSAETDYAGNLQHNQWVMSLLPTDLPPCAPFYETDENNPNYIKLKNLVQDIIDKCDYSVREINTQWYYVNERLAVSTSIEQSEQFKKILAITAWITSNIEYNSTSKTTTYTCEEMYDFLFNTDNPKYRKGVCNNFARLTSLMLYIAGIPNVRVSNVKHTWNLAYVDGQWIDVDATPSAMISNVCSYTKYGAVGWGTPDGLSVNCSDLYDYKITLIQAGDKTRKTDLSYDKTAQDDIPITLNIPSYIQKFGDYGYNKVLEYFKIIGADKESHPIYEYYIFKNLTIVGDKGKEYEQQIKNYADSFGNTYCIKYNGNKFTAKGTHSFVNGKCTVCGQSAPVVKTNNTTTTNPTATTVKKVVVNTPTMKLTSGKKLFKVKYTKVKNAVGFQVKYKIGKKTYTKTFNSTKSVTKTIKSLKKGTYKVQIRAFSKGKKSYSKWSKTKSVKVK